VLELLLDPMAWVAFATLTALELVLGIDNIIFIAILVERLPPREAARARRIGLALALILRIVMLALLSWMAGLTAALFTLFGNEISGRDIVLIGGGLFLLWKSTREIHASVQGEAGERAPQARASFAGVITQVALIDVVFSLDSIITAIGMVDELAIMVAAVVTAVALMMVFSGPVARFIAENPTLKMLALAFLVVVGVVLIADGFDYHVPKGYVYFAMAFAFGVEMLNMRARRLARRH
jgi:predicted tellurium resistance membrane protein TerC